MSYRRALVATVLILSVTYSTGGFTSSFDLSPAALSSITVTPFSLKVAGTQLPLVRSLTSRQAYSSDRQGSGVVFSSLSYSEFESELRKLDDEIGGGYLAGRQGVAHRGLSKKPVGTFRTSKPVISRMTSQNKLGRLAVAATAVDAQKANGYSKYTLVPPPKSRIRKVNRPMPVSSGVYGYPSFTPSNPWAIPVSIDLSGIPNIAIAMRRTLEFAGYRLKVTGKGVDRIAVASLAAPVPLSQRRIDAPSLIDALITLAGPGLIVVVDHANRVVSVDTSLRSVKLSRKNG